MVSQKNEMENGNQIIRFECCEWISYFIWFRECASYFVITGKDSRYPYFAFYPEKFHSDTQQFSLRRAICWYYLPEKKLLRASFSRGFLPRWKMVTRRTIASTLQHNDSELEGKWVTMQIVECICAAERRTTKRAGGRCIESAWICVTMGRWIFLGDILPLSEGRETER